MPSPLIYSKLVSLQPKHKMTFADQIPLLKVSVLFGNVFEIDVFGLQLLVAVTHEKIKIGVRILEWHKINST